MADKLGQVSTSTISSVTNAEIPIDESICGIIFDIGTRQSVFSGYSIAKSYFNDDQVQKISSLSDAEDLGITSDFFMGIPYYHLQKYYSYLGTDKDLYLMFADLTNSSVDDSPIEKMILGSEGNVFQIGIWTETNVFAYDDAVAFSKFVSNMNSQALLIKGDSETPSLYPAAVNLIICGGLGAGTKNKTELEDIDLPDCVDMDYALLSILIGQDSSASNSKIKTNAQIGLLGLTMACLALSGAEESIAYVDKYNLNNDDSMSGAVLGVGSDLTPISSMNKVHVANLANKGYIFPVSYDGKEGGIYFSSDSTMSDGDYCTISANRVVDRMRRIIRRVLTPMINGPIVFEPDSNMQYIPSNSATVYINNITDAVNAYMINDSGQSQVSAFYINVDTYQPNLKDDELDVDVSFAYLESENVISFTEKFNTK